MFISFKSLPSGIFSSFTSKQLKKVRSNDAFRKLVDTLVDFAENVPKYYRSEFFASYSSRAKNVSMLYALFGSFFYQRIGKISKLLKDNVLDPDNRMSGPFFGDLLREKARKYAKHAEYILASPIYYFKLGNYI